MPSSCRFSLPPVSLFKLRSNDHYEQRTWLVASGVKAFSEAATVWFDSKLLLVKGGKKKKNCVAALRTPFDLESDLKKNRGKISLF